MAAVPSIKGSVFSFAVEDVLKLVSAGKLSRSELERRLQPEDLPFLDNPIAPAQWYDVRVYARLVELLRDVEGGGRNDYLERRGALSAEKLLNSGVYQQLEYLNRTQVQTQSNPEERAVAFGRDLRLLVSLNGSILNFSKWESKRDPTDPHRWIIEVSDASAYPEVLCWSTLGLINRMASQHGAPGLWRWERLGPSIIHYRMTRPA